MESLEYGTYGVTSQVRMRKQNIYTAFFDGVETRNILQQSEELTKKDLKQAKLIILSALYLQQLVENKKKNYGGWGSGWG